jgi:hypothetical protein
MIAYQAYNIKSPLDGEAAMWADLNRELLPIDKRDLVPSSDTAANAIPPTPPVTAQAGAESATMVGFSCVCGQAMQGQRELIGKLTQCPACGQPVAISDGSAPQTTANADLPLSAAQPRAVADEFDDRPEDANGSRAGSGLPVSGAQPGPVADEFDDRPADANASRAPSGRTQGKERRGWPWMVVIAALLLVGGGVTAWLVFFRAVRLDPDLALVPADAVGFVSFRLGDWWNSEPGKHSFNAIDMRTEQSVYSLLAGFQAIDGDKGVRVHAGDIERVTAVFFPGKDADRHVVLIVAGNKPLNKQGLARSVIFGGGQTRTLRGKTYYCSVNGDRAIYFESPQIVVAGTSQDLEVFLQKTFKQKTFEVAPAGALAEGLQLAQGKKYQLVAVGVPKVAIDNTYAELQSVLVSGNLANEIEIDMHLKFPDDPKAKKGEDAVRAEWAERRKEFSNLKKKFGQGLSAAQVQQIIDPTDEVLQSMTLDRQGAMVHISARVKGDLVKRVNFAMLLGREVPWEDFLPTEWVTGSKLWMDLIKEINEILSQHLFM